ncbi:MAG: lipopolysaccharide transport periplasmic protein LptA [Methyloprofundus sp.]|nr:lipopolysaccharide transport periplasmic protein LptA [Methyloprofundus sp.]
MFMSKYLLVLFFWANVMLVPLVSALESDTSQPISIESNSGVYDDKKGVSIYTGEVIIIQGSMRLDADKVVVYLDNREIQKMVATGTPMKFQQTPEAGKEDVHGHSLVAEYYPETEVLIMMQEAVIWQGGNSTASERIEYDRMSEVLKAGDGKSANKRIKVILQPKARASNQ